ncbi:MAG TPA: molybdopterin converting factor subunit 1 [Candidatus Sulfotelmatobacter sp.]|nr:molybdopterin converting factor subunit 1 [Candidatus Sulfotelmatobacter sp.]
MKVLYFAWLRSKTGVAEETVAPPPGVTTVASLIEHLRARGGGYEDALRDLSCVRVAVNQEFAELDQAIGASDEIALFPPVTGG